MRYTVEDTKDGFRLTAQFNGEPGTRKVVYEEDGGHGPIERLYVAATETWVEARSRQRVEASS